MTRHIFSSTALVAFSGFAIGYAVGVGSFLAVVLGGIALLCGFGSMHFSVSVERAQAELGQIRRFQESLRALDGFMVPCDGCRVEQEAGR